MTTDHCSTRRISRTLVQGVDPISHPRNQPAPQSTPPSLQSPIPESEIPSMVPENRAHVIQQEPIIQIYHFLGPECSGLWRRAREHGLCRRHVDGDQQGDSADSVTDYSTEGVPRIRRSATPELREERSIQMSQFY
ncbi:uncharacterized protein ASPGLDRAFT_626401 [Aspergillus glaucus CBS 516.65]|uniref:Uncharacterized protein n=1 Tax=Aspergillus glaucus CBS 516.65 TaxID=1160497 RepID=A0A1L9VCI0_ASPGL|nr:hypothetical protein ASPGLDRAFT_626401 [Aspergillus glaucus CBS 516.65]OJJ81585.1 hypothetical protein ASPGLDRAFT_626401 [Aspergillus glaucus CBS 516.65]